MQARSDCIATLREICLKLETGNSGPNGHNRRNRRNPPNGLNGLGFTFSFQL
jgi:hypothetical protein